MNIYFIPSKTFLLGEYAVLFNSTALVLNTLPAFELRFTRSPSANSAICPFDLNSPAEKFYTLHKNFFADYAIDFFDPHNGRGGFGASSAQFLALYAMKNTIEKKPLLNCFEKMAWNGVGIRPSGADVLAQYTGNIAYIDKTIFTTHSFNWPFPNMGLVLFHTQQKVLTHQHLKNVNTITLDAVTAMRKIVNTAKQALENIDQEVFIECIQRYNDLLHQQQFVAEHTKQLLKNIHQQTGVFAAKGCGALGADVLLVCINKHNKPDFLDWAAQQNLIYIADETHLTKGLSHEMVCTSPC